MRCGRGAGIVDFVDRRAMVVFARGWWFSATTNLSTADEEQARRRGVAVRAR
jgi:hypothetical protein